MSLGETVITIIAIVTAAGLMIIVPFSTVSQRTDDISQLAISTSTTDFVNSVRTTGILTLDDYEKFIEDINSTGHNYEIEMSIGRLDENAARKVSQMVSGSKIGENERVWQYQSQVTDLLDKPPYEIQLNEGDMFVVKVKNKEQTIAEQLNKAFLGGASGDSYAIAAEGAGLVTTNGN